MAISKCGSTWSGKKYALTPFLGSRWVLNRRPEASAPNQPPSSSAVINHQACSQSAEWTYRITQDRQNIQKQIYERWALNQRPMDQLLLAPPFGLQLTADISRCCNATATHLRVRIRIEAQQCFITLLQSSDSSAAGPWRARGTPRPASAPQTGAGGLAWRRGGCGVRPEIKAGGDLGGAEAPARALDARVPRSQQPSGRASNRAGAHRRGGGNPPAGIYPDPLAVARDTVFTVAIRGNLDQTRVRARRSHNSALWSYARIHKHEPIP
jgi:hypothetical protein